ncbi:glycine/sarcosine/betaine reductase complex component C subunit alpha [Oceanidesulfovibrio marinus]|uniref:Glycine reductase n=1 Tax=Oceanidesulfovibrio marinus TaxID=370038 RepID=A0ABX6NAF0_9BACT|nr:glycine/sarcosine/betaine reductase complex component C subunit alpha [Oceanidesulfovibrio marinus]QJT07560.1 glycine reductase [Oceanidesulfovibrio marinus]
MNASQRHLIAEALASVVDKARHGGPVVKIGLMATGSELGQEEILRGGRMAQEDNAGLRVVAIGPRMPGFDDLEWIETPDSEAELNAGVEKALSDGAVSGLVAMHFPFPIGVATIGRSMTPGRGKPMFIASCTGTTAHSRGESLLRNAVYGIAVAKACGVAEPSLAFLNIDGAGPVLRAFSRMKDRGYAVSFGTSGRGDGGSLLRGNDLVAGSVDVLVCDTLTGNVLSKVFSTFTTAGQYETTGWGYGPSVGEGWNKIVSIVSRASGAPVIAGALALTARAAKGGLPDVVAAELKAARAAGFDEEQEALKPKAAAAEQIPEKPPVVPVDEEIAGVDVLDMEAAMYSLWKEKIYAETAMGCTGPVVRIQRAVKDAAIGVLKKAGYL